MYVTFARHAGETKFGVWKLSRCVAAKLRSAAVVPAPRHAGADRIPRPLYAAGTAACAVVTSKTFLQALCSGVKASSDQVVTKKSTAQGELETNKFIIEIEIWYIYISYYMIFVKV